MLIELVQFLNLSSDTLAIWLAILTLYNSSSTSVPTPAHLQSSVFKLSKDLIESIHEEGIVAYTS